MKSKSSEKLIMMFGMAAAVMTWLSGYYIMKVVYDSIMGSVLFATVVSLLAFFESQFMSVSLKIDGKVSISRREITGNLLQFIAATFFAILISIPLAMMIFELCNGALDGSLNDRFLLFVSMYGEHWFMNVMIIFLVVVLFNAPIIVKLKSIDE